VGFNDIDVTDTLARPTWGAVLPVASPFKREDPMDEQLSQEGAHKIPLLGIGFHAGETRNRRNSQKVLRLRRGCSASCGYCSMFLRAHSPGVSSKVELTP